MAGIVKTAPSVVTNISDITFSTTSSIRSARQRLAHFEGRQGKGRSRIFCGKRAYIPLLIGISVIDPYSVSWDVLIWLLHVRGS